MTPTHEADPLSIVCGNVQRVTRIFYIFTFSILGSLFAGIFILLSNKNTTQAAFIAASLPLVFMTVFFISRKKFNDAAAFLAIVLFSVVTVISTAGLGIHNISNFGFSAILIIANLAIRNRTLLFLNSYALACIAWLVFGEIAGLYTPDRLERSIPGDFLSAALILMLTSIMVRVLIKAVFQSSLEVQNELKERKRVEERLVHDALHDGLTGLPNRTLFLDRLGQRLELARRYPKNLFSVMFIDLDRFKVVNDSLGHLVGDKLLIATAQRLVQCLRPEDTVSRSSGDEFTILLNDFKETSDAIRVAERIQTILASTPMITDINRTTTASIGIAMYNSSYTQAQDMLRDADSAMYRAKATGGGQNQIFDETMYAAALHLIQMEADLKHGVEHNEWRVFYQPIISMPDRKIIGVEALVRWQHPQRGLCQPSEFIHTAEETGLIIPIGEFVIRETCWQLKAWRAEKHPDLWASINLSARQFQDYQLVDHIHKILEETGLPGNCIRMEITESVAMKDLTYSAKILNEITQLGVLISLDDFGNGYSSLGYLNRFPLKVLKIDRSFITDHENNQNNRVITTAIISLGHTLNMEVIAEGIETEKQLAFLQSASCNKIQGFLFSRPVPAQELELLF